LPGPLATNPLRFASSATLELEASEKNFKKLFIIFCETFLSF